MTGKKLYDSFIPFIRQHALLLLIVLVGTILRCWNLSNIPYTHDEISALLRTEFNSFDDLIEKGIRIDGHPAGVQTFLYFWTKLFGAAEWVVKLPFILTGILSIILIYKIGKNWFNETVGLAAAAFIATTEYTVMYSQIARPYTSGMFFALLLVYGWSKLVFDNDWKPKYVLLYVFGAALCAYNHHFSLLFAGLVGLIGLFIIQRKKLIRYLLFSALIVVLYLPHLSIFLYQLRIGGVESWLRKPENDFIIEYVKYTFNFSKGVYVLMALLFFGPLIFSGFRSKPIQWKKWILALTIFTLPFLAGFFYSRYNAAVLQYSVLIFGFPFLLLFFLGLLSKQSKMMNTWIVLSVLLLNSYALIFQREYYKVFYVSSFEQVLLDGAPLDSHKTCKLISSNPEKVRYYDRRFHFGDQFQLVDFTISPKAFQEIIEEKSKHYDQLYFGALSDVPPNFISIIRMYFPKIKWEKDYFITSTYLFAKSNALPKANYSLRNHLNKDEQTLWSGIDAAQFDGNTYVMKEGVEWSPGFTCPLKKLTKTPTDCIDVEVETVGFTPDHSYQLVVRVQTGDSTNYYTSIASSDLKVDTKTNRMKLVASIRMIDIPFDETTVLNAFIWNDGKLPLRIESFAISSRRGNKYLYSLFDEIR